MLVRALRGVCIGVNRHMLPGDIEDLDAALVTFLSGIGAVEKLPDAVPATPELEIMPVKSGAKEKVK